MIKHLRSSDLEKRKKGIRNATWDLTYIYSWAKNERERDERSLWLAASDDQALKKIARAIFTSEDADRDTKLSAHFEAEFGSSDGNFIFETYRTYECRTMDSGRIMNSFESEEKKAGYCKNLTSELERALFESIST
jgi:hypothetical protein